MEQEDAKLKRLVANLRLDNRAEKHHLGKLLGPGRRRYAVSHGRQRGISARRRECRQAKSGEARSATSRDNGTTNTN